MSAEMRAGFDQNLTRREFDLKLEALPIDTRAMSWVHIFCGRGHGPEWVKSALQEKKNRPKFVSTRALGNIYKDSRKVLRFVIRDARECLRGMDV